MSLNRLLSSSDASSLRISSASWPQYVFLLREEVVGLIPALPQISAKGGFCSSCFRMNAIPT